MNTYLKIFLLLLLPSVAWSQEVDAYLQAQRNHIDSLQNVLKHTTNDTLRMNISLGLGYYFNEVQRDSGIYYVDQSLMPHSLVRVPRTTTIVYLHNG